MRRNSMVRLHMLSFIPDTRPLFAAEFHFSAHGSGRGERGVSLLR